jgi:hypothetical protein
LTGKPVSKPSWTGKKFSELATEWKDSDDMNAIMQENTLGERRHETLILPRFNNIRHYVDDPPPAYEDHYEESPSGPVEDDGWVRVEKKARVKREKSFEELEEEYNNEGEQDETVWNDGPEEHETCWDSHKH